MDEIVWIFALFVFFNELFKLCALFELSEFDTNYEIRMITNQFIHNIRCIAMFAGKLYRNTTTGELELSKSQSCILEMNGSRKVVIYWFWEYQFLGHIYDVDMMS